MNLEHLDKEEFNDVPLYKMVYNNHGDLPFFITRYTTGSTITELHRHEYMQINYVIRGKAEHVLNMNHFEIVKGDIFVIPPYIPHDIVPSEDSSAEIFEFEFTPSFINQDFKNMQNAESFLDFAYIEPFLVSENLVKPRLNLLSSIQIEVEYILNEALIEFNGKKPGYILMVKSLLLKLLVIIGREFTAFLEDAETQLIYDRHREAIFNAVKHIDTHYAEDLRIEEVSKISALSQSYFSYLFKSITSKTFIEYVNDLRVVKSLELLRNTDKKVIDISFDVGFNNVNHFNRVFKRQMGIAPLSYRKQKRE